MAGQADVIGATVQARGGDLFDFTATIRSRDTGWDRYADGFEVLAPDGRVLGERKLLHPHVGEQPFTRELNGVRIPPGIAHVELRAHMKGVGYGGARFALELPGR